MITFNNEIKDFKPYRSAYVLPQVCIPLNEDQIKDLRIILRMNKVELSNHCCFRSGDFWFQYSDNELYIGNELVEKHW